MTVYTLKRILDASAPAEYKPLFLDQCRREFGIELIGLLYKEKLPAVIDIEETIDAYPPYNYVYDWKPRCDEITIKVTVTPVAHRDVTIAHNYNTLEFHPVPEYVSMFHRFKRFIGLEK